MRTIRRIFAFALAIWTLAACSTGVSPTDASLGGETVVPNQYIVTLSDTTARRMSAEGFDVAVERLGRDLRVATGRPLRLINGFVASDLDAQDVAALLQDPRIATIEPDVILTVQGTQASAVWNLDRLDQRALPLDTTFSFGVTGAGVTVYVVDTGIRSTHAEFGGRVRPGFTTFTDRYGTDDCHGHGTHVAGTVGGATYGVAREVALVPVRVMSCSGSGSVSGIISGLDWIATHRTGPAVANMSIGGGASNALDTAVRNLIAGGVTVAVAAGNANDDACSYSPARVGEAITTGATTNSDARASYSNYGACVNVFAPGSGVRAATNTSDTSSGTKSGTSMASPHAAGVAALLLQITPSATPGQVFTMVRDAATSGRLTGLGAGSPNLLLYADPALSSATTPTPEPQPEPEPAPAPGPAPAPCSDCSVVTGALAAGGTATWPAPDGSGYVTATTGLHQAWLRGPAGAEFDLVLERWNGRRWSGVASAGTPGASEDLSYSGKAGTYRWIVVSASGEGDYALYLKLP